jgi:carbon-monoxide dehydrogenase small subunit
MVMAAYFLLAKNPNPSETEIKHGIAGNLCRCTGYLPIVEAVKAAARKLGSGGAAS